MADYQPARLTVACVLALTLAGCGDDRPAVTILSGSLGPISAELVARTRLDLMEAAITETRALAHATDEFMTAPATDTRQRWQQQWIAAHDAWLAASVLIRDPGDSIDPWPVQPGFFDSLPEYPGSGIVNDMTLNIESSVLREQHHVTDESEVALGFHVIEYYAFARELSSFITPASAFTDRRRLLVQMVMQMLQEDLELRYQQLTDINAPPAVPRLDSAEDLLAVVQANLESISQEYQSAEHSVFSHRVPQDIRTRLLTLDTLIRESGLGEGLQRLDPEAARILNGTLEEAIGLLPESGPLQEAAASRMVLLLASLDHQASDFLAMLPG